MDFINKVLDNKDTILQLIAYVISLASIIVKITPTLRDDSILLPIVKFVGKYIALDKNIKDRPTGTGDGKKT